MRAMMDADKAFGWLFWRFESLGFKNDIDMKNWISNWRLEWIGLFAEVK